MSNPILSVPGDIVDISEWAAKYGPLAELRAAGARITDNRDLVAEEDLVAPHNSFVVHGLDMGAYARSLRAPVRGLWSGAMDYSQAYDAFYLTVERYLTLAWHGGLKEAGIDAVEMSVIERQALSAVISKEQGFIAGFMNIVMDGSKKNGGKLGPLVKQIDQWATRAIDAQNKAKLLAKSDPKLEWVVGPTEISCTTCFDKLQGKVKRASYWLREGVQPQNPPNPLLECGGWR